ncbi:MAG TPA: hypothetical protein VK797_28620 [Tepidisphaeraceae bacterium]|jgi:hypothetical protein|nr:hypothetical protein [Tepidisphaeraceae bacterium]
MPPDRVFVGELQGLSLSEGFVAQSPPTVFDRKTFPRASWSFGVLMIVLAIASGSLGIAGYLRDRAMKPPAR